MLFVDGSGDGGNPPLISRRAGMGFAWGMFIAASAVALAATGRFMFPNVINEPNGRLNDQQQLFETSGLKFRPTPTGWYAVEALAPGLPGDEAGLQLGDLVLQINNKDASQLTLADIQALLSGPVTTHVLHIDRLGSTRTVTLQLKNTI